MRFRKYAVLNLFLCVFSFGWSQDELRDMKQHPELSIVVQGWASKLSFELSHFSDMVTRKERVKNSFKDMSIVVEDGKNILADIHERISEMMKKKIEAVGRIMDIAEQAAQAQKDDDVDLSFQFYNAKNLTNSLENSSSLTDEETADEKTLASMTKDNNQNSENAIIENIQFEENIPNDLNPNHIEIFQRDKTLSEERNLFFESEDIDETTEEEEDLEHPQASQTHQFTDKTKLPLYRNKHFYNIPVNINYSAVHVPSNVYDRSKAVIAGIMWSEELDKTFRNNYKHDPTLSWQYFGSSNGFMRQFPAMVWSQEPIDLFDCRTRSWYIEAASSPKDIVILVDRSGSMTGMRREIARHVVYNILDTLGNNDYVNIYSFSNTTEPLIECFDGKLVQANLANIRTFKENMGDFKTEQIANLSLALTTAFELLAEYRELKLGANCNQAIMLVTDGSQDNYQDVFQKYNWDHLPIVTVRLFTYLVGREVSDPRDVKWMACANQGYYVHLSTYAEVREEVLQYIPVMARPMVLNGNQKPNPTWSPVYADVTDPKLTNWLWANRQRNAQRERFQLYSRQKIISDDTLDKLFVQQQKLKPDNYGETQIYHLMTSVSLPVYDKKPRQNISEKVQISEETWITVTREENVANLLGVAGTDVPIEYIQRLMLPYRLGVNGYGFIVTNNGYILLHPDLRPVYQGILKPAYNKIDVMEVEIAHDETEPRRFNEEMREFRNKIIMQKIGNITMTTKSHLDDMKRIQIRKRHYFYRGINDTPFSLVISLPDKYGFKRVSHNVVENDPHRLSLIAEKDRKIDNALTQYFTGNWTIHPDWLYCRYYDDKHVFETAEEEFMYFLKKIENPGWKWSETCDRKLVAKVVVDAKVTKWFNNSISDDKGAQLIKEFGIVVAFMATHTGLTRWQNFPQNIDNSIHEKHFQGIHNKAIDEVWYKRAIDQCYSDSQLYVYSVPHEIGSINVTNGLVTVSSGVFKEDGIEKAPVAVVGYQFYHSALYNIFKKATTYCVIPEACKKTCESEELHCLLLDDNGYVIVSDNIQETGFFFGNIRADVMSMLIDEEIYKVYRMFDYQAICSERLNTGSAGTTFFSPHHYFATIIIEWIFSILTIFTQVATGNFYYESAFFQNDQFEETASVDHQDHLFTMDHDQERDKDRDYEQEGPEILSGRFYIDAATIPKTKPEPCDNEFYLYNLVHYNNKNETNSAYNQTMGNCSRPFIVQRVDRSNMILLVINNLCHEQPNINIPTPEHVEVNYNMSSHCFLNQEHLPRRLYMSCINRTANESQIKLCGSGTNISPTFFLPLMLSFYFSLYFIFNVI